MVFIELVGLVEFVDDGVVGVDFLEDEFVDFVDVFCEVLVGLLVNFDEVFEVDCEGCGVVELGEIEFGVVEVIKFDVFGVGVEFGGC